MASEVEVKQYLAHWFQLGKKVILNNAKEKLLPNSVIAGDHYSQAFEDCWRKILAANQGDSYLEGTEETIADLLSPSWEISSCANCEMPVPTKSLGVSSLPCPCQDIPNWPNTEIPQPRLPVSSQQSLSSIRKRLSR